MRETFNQISRQKAIRPVHRLEFRREVVSTRTRKVVASTRTALDTIFEPRE